MQEFPLEPDPRNAGFSDPFLYALALRGEPLSKIVHETGGVEINGTICSFKPSAVPVPPPGTDVKVFGRFSGQDAGYYCVFAEDYERHLQEKQDAYLAHQRRIQDAKDAAEASRQRAAKDRHERGQLLLKFIQMPVAWHVRYKSVVRALTQNSRGDGLASNAVYHVSVDAPLSAGRFERKAGEFLCSQTQSKWGGAYTPETMEQYEFEGVKYDPLVTCPKCIEIMARKGWLNEAYYTHFI